MYWWQTVKEAGVSNYLIVAIDTQLRDDFTKRGANVYFKDVQASPALLHCGWRFGRAADITC